MRDGSQSRDGRFTAFSISEQDETGQRESLATLDMRNPDTPVILPAPLVSNDVGVPGQRRLNFFAAEFEIEGNSLVSLDFDYYTYTNASDSRGPIRRGYMRRWDLAHKQILPTTVCEVEGLEAMMIFSPDARFLVSATNERGQSAHTVVRLWSSDLPLKESVTLGEVSGVCSALVFSHDNQMVAVGGENGEVTLFDRTDPGSDPTVLTRHRDCVRCMVFSPDGATLASGAAGGTIRLSSLHQMRATPVIFEAHQGAVCSMQFSPDGRILVSGGEDGIVRLWIAQREALADLVKQMLERRLTSKEWDQYVGVGFEDELLESPFAAGPVPSHG